MPILCTDKVVSIDILSVILHFWDKAKYPPLRTTYSENRQQTGVTEHPEQITRQSWSEVPGKILEQHDGDQCAEQ